MQIILLLLKDIILIFISAIIARIISDYNFRHKLDEQIRNNESLRSQYQLINRWFSLTNEGIDIKKYLVDKGYKNIAIYGMAELGERLYESLKNTDINVKYAIDIAKYGSRKDIDIKNLDDPLEPVDAIIVTPFLTFEDIAFQLRRRNFADIVSLEDIIESL